MITQLKGNVVEIQPSNAVIDCNGVGYNVVISLNTFEEIKNQTSLTIFTHLAIKEDAHILYGFSSKNEREIFLKLIGVNGVGPSSTIMMLSTLSVAEIQQSIQNGDAKTLQSVKGIGLKTAQRIIVDLKDKLDDIGDLLTDTNHLGNKTKNEALSALGVLGISKKLVESKLDKIMESSPNLSVEQLVKEVLKKL